MRPTKALSLTKNFMYLLQYFRVVVLPLLIIVKNMESTIQHLCNVIQKKDQEIEEYKLEGAVLTRSKLKMNI